MKATTIYDASLLNLPFINNESGNITAINNSEEIPFNTSRVYYLYDVPGGSSRGGHAHIELEQLIVAASGSFDIILDDGKVKRTIHLNRPNIGLYMPSGLWRELDNFSSGAICLVLASHTYDEKDYIRNYNNFISYKNEE
ncbi:MAG: FdtA/QdtA family cupin domain-containing protein [Balneola sp.]